MGRKGIQAIPQSSPSTGQTAAFLKAGTLPPCPSPVPFQTAGPLQSSPTLLEIWKQTVHTQPGWSLPPTVCANRINGPFLPGRANLHPCLGVFSSKVGNPLPADRSTKPSHKALPFWDSWRRNGMVRGGGGIKVRSFYPAGNILGKTAGTDNTAPPTCVGEERVPSPPAGASL